MRELGRCWSCNRAQLTQTTIRHVFTALTKTLQLSSSPPVISPLLQRPKQSMWLGPMRSVEELWPSLPLSWTNYMTINTLLLPSHSRHQTHIFTRLAEDTHQLGADAHGWTRQPTRPTTPSFASFIPPSSPAFLRLVKSPWRWLGKPTDLNTFIHTRTLHHKGGEKKAQVKAPCFHCFCFYFKWSGSTLSLPFPLPCYLLYFFLCLSVSSLVAEWQAGFSRWVPLIPV